MNRVRRTEVRIETNEIQIIRNPKSAMLCPECQSTALITPEDATLISGLDWRDIYRRIEQGAIHYATTAQGLLLVCPRSLNEGPMDSSRATVRTLKAIDENELP